MQNRQMFYKDEPFSMTICFENFNNNEEIDNRMNELADDESDEYKNYNSADSGEGTMEKSS
jgi:hypothetical protein